MTAIFSGVEGEVSMVLMLDRGAAVCVMLPGRCKVSPQIAGALKEVPGSSRSRSCEPLPLSLPLRKTA
jgi:hypothetical protein